MLFQVLGSRKVVADFSGGALSSDGGLLLLRQVDSGLGVSRTIAKCFTDARDPLRVEHSVPELVRQRLFALALGYEDLNDHSDLRRDPLLATAVGKEDVLGEDRRCAKDAGFACASPATLNRLELGANFSDRYRKVHADPQALEDALLELGVRCLPTDSKVLILDFDATDDPLHGRQEGRFFHGYYGNYCYLPLYCFCGSVPLWAQLRSSDKDASTGTVEALKKIVAAIRRRMPKVKIVVRGAERCVLPSGHGAQCAAGAPCGAFELEGGGFVLPDGRGEPLVYGNALPHLHELEPGAPDAVQGGDAARTEKQPSLCGHQYP